MGLLKSIQQNSGCQTAITIFSIIWTIIGAIGAFSNYESWEDTTATFIQTAVHKLPMCEEKWRKCYTVEVISRYTVNGKTYKTSQIRFKPVTIYQTQKEAEAEGQRHMAAKTTPVRYKEQDPTRVHIPSKDRAQKAFWVWFTVIGGVVLVTSLIIMASFAYESYEKDKHDN